MQHLEDTVENRDQLLHQNEELTDRLKNTLVELTNLSELHEKIKEEKDLEIKVEEKILILLYFFHFPLDRRSKELKNAQKEGFL